MQEMMLEEMARSMRIIESGHAVEPSWRAIDADGDSYYIRTLYDPNDLDHFAEVLRLVARFLTWREARGYVLTAEIQVGASEEAVMVIGVTAGAALGVMRLFARKPRLVFDELLWLDAHQLDQIFTKLLPGPDTPAVKPDEVEELLRLLQVPQQLHTTRH
jgi:hypothetical protein